MKVGENISTKYEIVIDGEVKYFCHAVNPTVEKEMEIIAEIKERYKDIISLSNCYTIYKTVKSRIE